MLRSMRFFCNIPKMTTNCASKNPYLTSFLKSPRSPHLCYRELTAKELEQAQRVKQSIDEANAAIERGDCVGNDPGPFLSAEACEELDRSLKESAEAKKTFSIY